MTVKFVVDDAAPEGVRADHAVRVRFPSVDRAFALKLLKEGRLRIDNKLANLTARAVVGSTIEEQTHAVLRYIGTMLKSQGLDYTDVLSSSVFMKDLNEFAAEGLIQVSANPE